MTEFKIPEIEGTSGKVAVLERRVEFLQRKLDRPDYTNSASADFDRAEVSALRGAIRALRYCSARLRPEADPVKMLEWFLVETERFHDGEGTDEEFDLAIERVRNLLKEHSS